MDRRSYNIIILLLRIAYVSDIILSSILNYIIKNLPSKLIKEK